MAWPGGIQSWNGAEGGAWLAAAALPAWRLCSPLPGGGPLLPLFPAPLPPFSPPLPFALPAGGSGETGGWYPTSRYWGGPRAAAAGWLGARPSGPGGVGPGFTSPRSIWYWCQSRACLRAALIRSRHLRRASITVMPSATCSSKPSSSTSGRTWRKSGLPSASRGTRQPRGGQCTPAPGTSGSCGSGAGTAALGGGAPIAWGRAGPGRSVAFGAADGPGETPDGRGPGSGCFPHNRLETEADAVAARGVSVIVLRAYCCWPRADRERLGGGAAPALAGSAPIGTVGLALAAPMAGVAVLALAADAMRAISCCDSATTRRA